MKIGYSLFLLIAFLVAALLIIADFRSDALPAANNKPVFDSAFYAAADGDMAATAYADGKLAPLGIEKPDRVMWIDDGEIRESLFASNSVISWPQIIDTSPDGNFVYVVETKGPASMDVDTYDNVYKDFPNGSKLQTYWKRMGSRGEYFTLLDTKPAGLNPQSVSASKDGRFLIVASEQNGAELVVFTLKRNAPTSDIRKLSLDISYRDRDTRQKIRTAHLSPDGKVIAVNIANKRYQFFSLEKDENDIPTKTVPLGDPTPDGNKLSVGKWTPDGKYFLYTDVFWGESSFDALFSKRGVLRSIKVDPLNGYHKEVGQIKVGHGPEGFDISDDSKMAITVNMGRTFLPERPFLKAWPKRKFYSLSLIDIDNTTGGLSLVATSPDYPGILPEDAIFDKSGRNIAVAVFHRRHGENRNKGFIDYWSIKGDAENRSLEPQNAHLETVRGPHDLVRAF